MTALYYEIRLCQNCGLRYPLTEGHPFGTRCPSCLGETKFVSRQRIGGEAQNGSNQPPPEYGLHVFLDNLRSAWNVGAIFRTADGIGARKLYLCGITPTPEKAAVRKTSLGAEESVAWDYSPDSLQTAHRLKTEGYRLIALEQDPRAVPLGDCQIPDSRSRALILGNEVTGVDPEILALCDHIVYIPMFGKKNSFNVEVAFGIAAYQLLHGNK